MWCLDPRQDTSETPPPLASGIPAGRRKGGSNSLTSSKEFQAPHCPEEGGQGELKPKSRGECKLSSPTFSWSTGSIALKGRAAIVLTAQPKEIKMWCLDPRQDTSETPPPLASGIPAGRRKGGSNSLTSSKEFQAPHCPPSQGGKSKTGHICLPTSALLSCGAKGKRKKNVTKQRNQGSRT